ncbi:MAG: M42 family metallopeptidase [Bacillota bacterium]|nr:M42 family metallopeptidase [Bacillota bacterium]
MQVLSEATGPSGHEGEVASLIVEALRPLADEVSLDRLGNVVALKRGEGGGPSVMWAAHMDEIGLMVADITEEGFLRVHPVGGIDRRTLLAQEVWVHGRKLLPGIVGTKPPHLLTPEEQQKIPPFPELFVDVGLGPEVKELVRPGDLVTIRRRSLSLLGSRVSGKAFDNRASVVAMVEGLKVLARLRHRADVLAVATVQEEVGLRGATTAAFGLSPDAAIAIDVTFAQQPSVREDDSSKMAAGVDIARGANIHPDLFSLAEGVARREGIPYQVSILPAATGTDAWAIQVAQEGVPTGLFSIPLRYMHSSVEVVDLQDIAATGRLLAHFSAALEEAQVKGWSHGDPTR